MKLKLDQNAGAWAAILSCSTATQPAYRSERRAIPRARHHNFGVGCDQILLVERATQPGVDFRYRIFRTTAVRVEQCGNGALFRPFRACRGLTDKREIRVETAKGIIGPQLEDNGEVTVDMGRRSSSRPKCHFIADAQAAVYPLDVIDGKTCHHRHIDGQPACGAGG